MHILLCIHWFYTLNVLFDDSGLLWINYVIQIRRWYCYHNSVVTDYHIRNPITFNNYWAPSWTSKRASLAISSDMYTETHGRSPRRFFRVSKCTSLYHGITPPPFFLLPPQTLRRVPSIPPAAFDAGSPWSGGPWSSPGSHFIFYTDLGKFWNKKFIFLSRVT